MTTKRKFISKEGEWFDAGTEAILIEEFKFTNQKDDESLWGLFEGIRNGNLDQEICQFDEFDIIEQTEE